MEYGTNTDQRIKDAIDKWVPDADNVLVVLNELGVASGSERSAAVARPHHRL